MRLLAIVCLLACTILGCESKDQQEIRDVYARMLQAQKDRDGHAWLACVSKKSVAWHTPLIAIGLDGTPEQVRALPPMERAEVFLMRTKGSRAKLTGLTAEQYLQLQVTDRWFTDDDISFSLRDVRVTGESGDAELVADGEGTKERTYFIKEDGKWVWDIPTTYRVWNTEIPRDAKAEGITVDQYLFDLVEYWCGLPVHESVWQPMPR